MRTRLLRLARLVWIFFHKPYDAKLQEEVFRAHLNLAVRTGLPLTLHIRSAIDEAMKILEEYKGRVRGVMHCFQQSLDVAKMAVGWGLYLGITGTVTYPKNDLLREVVKVISLDRLLLETDAPFLPPQAFRGKPNQPAYIPMIANQVAEVLEISVVEVARVTTTNANELFAFSKFED